MTPQTTLINDWSAGEISPTMYGRFGHPIHDRGCQILENFIVTEQAILTKRAGTEYLGLCYGSTNRARIIPYTYSKDEAYIIELTNAYVRVWRNDAVVAGTSTNVPWTTAQLDDIQFCQDTTGVYFAHRSWKPVALVRTAQDTFAIGQIAFIYNTGAVYTSPATTNDVGDASLNVTEAIGASIPQQGTFMVEHAPGQYDFYSYTSWAVSKFEGISPILQRTYDASDKVILGHRYHSTDATAPFAASGNYPGTVAFVGGRMCFAGATNDPQRVWEGVAWGYEVDSGSLYVQLIMHEDKIITGTVATPASEWADPTVGETEILTTVRRIQTAAHAIDLVIASDRSEQILTMASAKHLFIGTTASEWIIPGSITALQPYVEKPVTRYGCSAVQPTLAGDAIIMVSQDKRRIREYRYAAIGQGYEAPNLTRYANHVTGATGIVQMDLSKDPFTHLYFVRADGELAVLTYEKDAGVVAWQRFTLPSGWTFKSIAVIAESNASVVYAIVFNGTNYYLVKFRDMSPATQSAIMFLDLAYDVTTDDLDLVSGSTLTCAWLASKTVAVVVDGVYEGDETASGAGEIDLTGYSGTQIWVGLKYVAKYRSVPSRAQVAAGTSENTLRRVLGLAIRVYRTMDLVACFNSYDPDDGDTHIFGDTWYSGIVEVQFAGEYDREACINIVSADPVPCTITSITPRAVGAEV